MPSRRSFVLGTSAALIAPLGRAYAARAMPSMFFAHGAPFLATDSLRGGQLRKLAAGLPGKPRGIIVFTPHVRAERITLAGEGIARRSFPRRFRKRVAGIRYAPPLNSGFVDEVTAALTVIQPGRVIGSHRGFNHTVWMGLLHMFPDADIPVVEIAMPFEGPEYLFAMGAALAPLRQSGVLVVASGSLTHNLATIGIDPTPGWAIEFDRWIGETFAAGDLDTLFDWRSKAPASNIVHPDDGAHFNVVMCAVGAAAGDGSLANATAMNAGWEFGSFTTREYLFE